MGIQVLGVRIDTGNKQQFLATAGEFLRDGSQHTIFTPNPEILVDATTDEYFRSVLNSGSLNICDGTGLALVSHGKLKRIPGVEFMINLCALAEMKGAPVYLLGAQDSMVLQRVGERLKTQFPHLHLAGTHPGESIQKEGEKILYDIEVNKKLVHDINEKKPAILFVAFGSGKQEKWIYENITQMPSVRIAMGVGGAFDMISGKIPRAPRLLRAIGLEWLWRLIIEPKRIGRIWKATGRFLYLYLFFSK